MKNIVNIIFDFHDCPRSGITSFNGKEHTFECIFDDSEDKYSDKYLLKRLDSEVLELLEEESELRNKWDNKTYKTDEDKKSYPVLPEDKIRFEMISQKIRQELTLNPESSFIQTGHFSKIEYLKSYGVEWS